MVWIEEGGLNLLSQEGLALWEPGEGLTESAEQGEVSRSDPKQ